MIWPSKSVDTDPVSGSDFPQWSGSGSCKALGKQGKTYESLFKNWLHISGVEVFVDVDPLAWLEEVEREEGGGEVQPPKGRAATQQDAQVPETPDTLIANFLPEGSICPSENHIPPLLPLHNWHFPPSCDRLILFSSRTFAPLFSPRLHTFYSFHFYLSSFLFSFLFPLKLFFSSSPFHLFLQIIYIHSCTRAPPPLMYPGNTELEQDI